MSVIVPIYKQEIQHPINAFPEYVQQIICHYSEAKGYPIEYFIQAFLGAASTAMGRAITLNTGNYTAISSLWCIILGRRGFVKSEPLTDAFKPIKKRQFEIYAKHSNEKQELDEYKANNPKAKITPLADPNKIILGDTTPEKLVMILAENPKGCGMVHDEIAGFVERFNRYNSGADEQMFLSLFNGDTILRDRINGGNAYAKHSYLTIIGTTQPTVLKDVFFKKSGSGFFDRWLITQPDNVVKQYPNHYGVNPVEEDKYSLIIQRLLNMEYDEMNFNQMTYPPDSYKIIWDYQCEMIDTQNDTDNDDLRGILAKMEIYLHKFCLILQAIEYSLSGDNFDLYKVSKESAHGAIILTKYFTDQAQRVRILSPIERLKDKWVDIYNALPEHGVKFDRKQFLKICAAFGIKDRAGDNFLKEHGMKSEDTLLFKIGHGVYTKNLF